MSKRLRTIREVITWEPSGDVTTLLYSPKCPPMAVGILFPDEFPEEARERCWQALRTIYRATMETAVLGRSSVAEPDPAELLRGLMAKDPTEWDCGSEGVRRCGHCDAEGFQEEATHKPDCPWLAAKEFLDDITPALPFSPHSTGTP